MHGGAHAQFAAVPLNLAGESSSHATQTPRCTSIDTGFWSRRAAAEHAKYCTVAWGASADRDEPVNNPLAPRDWRKLSVSSHAPTSDQWKYDAADAFIHICANETVQGVEFHHDPSLPRGAPPLVADFTSTLLSRPIEVSKYGVLYAS